MIHNILMKKSRLYRFVRLFPRKWKLSICLVVGMILLFLLPVQAATFIVNNLGDEHDANPGDGIADTSGGVTTLRAAAEEANAFPGDDTVEFDTDVLPNPAVIVLSTTIPLKTNISINGPGAERLVVSGGDAVQIFSTIKTSIEVNVVEFSDLTLSHGHATMANGGITGGALNAQYSTVTFYRSVITSCYSEFVGGGVYVETSNLFMFDCAINNNSANGSGAWGGGVTADAENLVLDHCIFSNNQADVSGAASFNLGTGTISNCVFNENQSLSTCGGIGLSGIDVRIIGCLIYDNSTAQAGGGMCIGGQNVFLVNSSIINNTSNDAGGGVTIGSIEQLCFLNCTITGNQAGLGTSLSDWGGGIDFSAPVKADAILQLGNTIVVGNTDKQGRAPDISGQITSLGGNLIGIGDGSTGFTGTNDQVGTTASPIDAKLGPLQDNGGPTFTCLPQAASPAINAGLNALITNPPFDGPPFYDQRGPDFVRIYEDIVDIGAVERQLPPDTTPPVITLLGDPLVSHECGTPYTDAGATAEDDIDGDITANIVVTGTVDSATPGVYTLTYNVSDAAGNPATPVSRTVTVEDTTPPQITLIGDPLVSHECHTPYTDPGATASDTCDLALPEVNIDTSLLNTETPGTYTVNFTIADAAGNSAPLVSRTVQVTDTLPPTITVLGDNPLTVQCLSPYTDPGATASDTCDLALPDVTIDTTALDLTTPGSYTVNYTISDASGNPAPLVSRTVLVEGPCIPPNHTADQNADYLISLSELLRVIQFFNSGGFHCQSGTEDGYAPGLGGDTSCTSHASDYAPHDWAIGLSELLRLIQFFNSSGYHVCSGSEDGFCPGP